VEADGTIHVRGFRLPLSAALSPEARQRQIAMLAASASGIGLPKLDGFATRAEFVAYIDEYRAALDRAVGDPLAEALAAAFPVERHAREIAGVRVEEFTANEGARDDRVLINLHGGAFVAGAIHGGRIESIPVAHRTRIPVVSVDYRQGYEHRFPAATEDVVAVYQALLQEYPPGRIGIYGGSAGAMLTGQVVTWLLDKGLPVPGAIGMFGSGGGGRGDATYFSAITSGRYSGGEIVDTVDSLRSSPFGYFARVMPDDYLAFPLHAPRQLLSRFPPTLLISATRAFDMSPVILFHRALRRAGAEADLHLFDGLGHCFYYNAWMPESEDAYETISRFFVRHLSG
jgi:epsilon-lactone hydrolase